MATADPTRAVSAAADRGGDGGVVTSRGQGLLKGLGVTLRTMTRRSITEQYPDVKPELPPRSRGVIALLEENCTSCMLCARECPDWCIYIDSHKEVIPAPEVGWPGAHPQRARPVRHRLLAVHVLRYLHRCRAPLMHCSGRRSSSTAEFDIRDMTHEKERLGQWMHTVPAPPALDSGAAESKELQAATQEDVAPERPTPEDGARE